VGGCALLLAGARRAVHAGVAAAGRRAEPWVQHPKPQLAVELVGAAQRTGIAFQAVVADCFYGDNPGFTQALLAEEIPFVLALSLAGAPGRPPRPPTPQSRPLANSAGAILGRPGGGGG
jgi:SRSO17 transposase